MIKLIIACYLCVGAIAVYGTMPNSDNTDTICKSCQMINLYSNTCNFVPLLGSPPPEASQMDYVFNSNESQSLTNALVIYSNENNA